MEYSIEGEMQYWVTELVYNEKRGYYFEGETGRELSLGEVLDFNEYMKSWRLSAFSKNYVLSGEAVALYGTDYQEVGGTFGQFYSISYLYGS